MNWDLIRLVAGVIVLVMGLILFGIEVFGVFRFEYVLNRMHAAAIGDTLGLGISMVGLMILSGFNFTSLKMLLVIVFLWFASPVSSHLIARLEVLTDEKELREHCEIEAETDEEAF